MRDLSYKFFLDRLRGRANNTPPPPRLHEKFYKIPPEIWGKIAAFIDRRDLASFALVSRRSYPHANPLLYKHVEVSFCKCSKSYITALERTLVTCPDLTGLVECLTLDATSPGHVWTTESLPSKWKVNPHWNFMTSYSRLGAPEKQEPAHIELNTEILSVLEGQQLRNIVSRLINVKAIILVLERFGNNPGVLNLVLQDIPLTTLNQVSSIKFRDVGIVEHPSLSKLASLRQIDLGYTSFRNSDLHALLLASSGTLEEFTLQWIIESSQTPLFEDFGGVSLPKLRALRIKGHQIFNAKGLCELIGDSPNVRELKVEALMHASAVLWGDVLNFLISRRAWEKTMRQVWFGAPVGCDVFWKAVPKFLKLFEDRLEGLSLSGSGKGEGAPFYPELKLFFEVSPLLPNLKSLTVIWRDGRGPDKDTAHRLVEMAPFVEFLHLYLPFPLEQSAEELLDVIKPCRNLRQLHLVFPLIPNFPLGETIDTPGAETRRKHASSVVQQALAESKNDKREAFIRGAVQDHPHLQFISWSLHDRREEIHPKVPVLFVQVERKGKTFTTQNLWKEFIDHKRGSAEPFQCTVGSKKAFVDHRPTWREYMSNPFLDNGSMCLYTDFKWKDGMQISTG